MPKFENHCSKILLENKVLYVIVDILRIILYKTDHYAIYFY